MNDDHLEELVRVHRNLNKDCWSVLQGGIVIDHVDEITLYDVEFRVQPSGQARCRRQGKRNVHAYVKGIVVGSWKKCFGRKTRVSYNPYEYDTFIEMADDIAYEVHFWNIVHFDKDGKAWLRGGVK